MFSYESILYYAAGNPDSSRTIRIPHNIEANVKANRTIAMYHQVARCLCEDDSFSPPDSTLARARAFFSRHSTKPKKTNRINDICDVIAHLIYDSRLQPALVRIADSDDRLQMIYNAGQLEIELQARPIASTKSKNTSSRNQWRIMGQVTGELPLATPLEMRCVGQSSSCVLTEYTDDRNCFQFELNPGIYELRINHSNGAVIIPDIHIE